MNWNSGVSILCTLFALLRLCSLSLIKCVDSTGSSRTVIFFSITAVSEEARTRVSSRAAGGRER